MPRRDYYNDPDAPTANSLVVATNVFVRDDQGRVLLIRRSDNGMWALPGGQMEVGETVAECAERECLEETGYHIRVTGIVGIYSDPNHVIAYDDGEIRQEFAICFRAELISGEARTSNESTALVWATADELDQYQTHHWINRRVRHGYYEDHQVPHLG